MIKVLVVDDSRFFRNTLCKLLESDSDIKVIAQANDGEQAIEMVERYQPDVITMDVEMPNMDGITAVKKIMAIRPTPIMMFSNLTEQGARITLEALHAGAADFQSKTVREESCKQQDVIKILQTKLKTLAAGRQHLKSDIKKSKLPSESLAVKNQAVIPLCKCNYQLIAIGASTGGPVALEKVLSCLPASFPAPIVIIQHMPKMFTRAFADRLDDLCDIHVKEIEDGDELQPGTVYIAPGGKQTYVKNMNNKKVLSIEESEQCQIYKPSVDETLKSIASEYPRGNTLAIIITGMGSDGCEGARMLKQTGSMVWAQDKASCVVYGMPMAVVNANLADKVLTIDDIASSLAKIA